MWLDDTDDSVCTLMGPKPERLNKLIIQHDNGSDRFLLIYHEGFKVFRARTDKPYKAYSQHENNAGVSVSYP